MPAEEHARGSSVRGAERCDLHPIRATVARCDGCGRALCLTCAIPVRGAVLGAECLPETLAEEVPRPRARPRPSPLLGAALGLCLVASALPWSRFGPGSGPFGAWDRDAGWALLAALATVLGAAIWLAERLLGRVWGPATRTIAATGAVVALAATMGLLRPPAFTRPWIGPWVAIVGGLAAVATSLRPFRGRRRAPR